MNSDEQPVINQQQQQQVIRKKSFLRFNTSSRSRSCAFLFSLVLLSALLISLLLSDSSSSPSSTRLLLLRHFSHSAAAVLTAPSQSQLHASAALESQAPVAHESEAPGIHESDVAAHESGPGAGAPLSDGGSDERCRNVEEQDLYRRGKWVYDPVGYPLYNSTSCPFMDQGFRCTENGRPDSDYLHWRWQPRCANLTFDPRAALHRLRGKRVVFVGDSIGRNQWESFVCLLASGVEDKSRIYEVNGNPITKHTGFLVFRFKDYNLTVEYYRSPFLVPQTSPPRGAPHGVRSVLRVDTVDWTAPRWVGADYLVFNAGHWWNFEKTIRGGCYFSQKNKVNMSMDVRSAFEAAIDTWASWIKLNVNPDKTDVFFRSYSSVHFRNGTWKSGGQCHQETEPVTDDGDGDESSREEAWSTAAVRRKLKKMVKKRARILDITELTDKRRDGHPSLWHRVGGSPKNKQDCSHWCLPGLPDTWNLLLLNQARIFD